MIIKQVIHYPDTNSIEVTWVDSDEKQIRCHSYADVQMQMLREHAAEMGTPLTDYEALIADVESKIVLYVPPALTPQEVQALVVSETQSRLDEFARTRNYDSILSACTYATSTVPKFASEGQCAVNARDATWSALYTLMAEVESGVRQLPTGFADVEPLLPELTWPV